MTEQTKQNIGIAVTVLVFLFSVTAVSWTSMINMREHIRATDLRMEKRMDKVEQLLCAMKPDMCPALE